MAGFKFRFDSVEKLRKTQEMQSVSAFLQAKKLVDTIVAEKEKLLSKLQQSLIEREGLADGEGIGPEHFAVQESFIQGVKLWIQQMEYRLYKANKILEKAQSQMVEARKKLKTMDQIHKRDYMVWQEKRRDQEEKTLQDLQVMRARLPSSLEGEET